MFCLHLCLSRVVYRNFKQWPIRRSLLPGFCNVEPFTMSTPVRRIRGPRWKLSIPRFSVTGFRRTLKVMNHHQSFSSDCGGPTPCRLTMTPATSLLVMPSSLKRQRLPVFFCAFFKLYFNMFLYLNPRMYACMHACMCVSENVIYHDLSIYIHMYPAYIQNTQTNSLSHPRFHSLPGARCLVHLHLNLDLAPTLWSTNIAMMLWNFWTLLVSEV